MSYSDLPLFKANAAVIIARGLNADSGDAERDALVELADMVGLQYNDEKERYE